MSAATYCYRAHGLTLDSEIELPELDRSEAAPDVRIRFGAVPERLGEPAFQGPNYQAMPGQYLLTMPRIARYCVTDGCQVVIERAPGAADEDIRVFVLSAVMGVLAHQRGHLVIHASAIDVDGGAVLLAGESGSGKSTLAAAFHDRGFPIITDDISVLSIDETAPPVVHPGYRHVRMWPDSLERVGASLGARRKVRVGLQKYSVAVPGPAAAAPLPVTRIFLLTRRITDRIELDAVVGRDKVNTLVRETYRRPTMVALGQRAAHFAQCMALARVIPVVRVRRPLNLDAIPHLVQALEADVRAAGAYA